MISEKVIVKYDLRRHFQIGKFAEEKHSFVKNLFGVEFFTEYDFN